MQWSQVIVAILGAGGLISVAGLSYFYNKNLKLREEQNAGKKKAYLDLIETLDDARFGQVKNPSADLGNKMRKHSREIFYYGSTGVLKAFGDLQQAVFASSKTGKLDMVWMKLLGELMFQMRKDLGNLRWRDRLPFRRNSERWIDSLKLSVTDIDDYLPKEYKGRRGRKYNSPGVMIDGKEHK